MAAQQGIDFRLDDFAREGRVVRLEAHHGGFAASFGIDPERRADRLRHARRPVLLHKATGVLLLLRVLVACGGICGAPLAVAIVAAVMSIPAQNVPQLWPREGLQTTQSPRRQQPGCRATGRAQGRRRQKSVLREKHPQPADSLPGRPDVARVDAGTLAGHLQDNRQPGK